VSSYTYPNFIHSLETFNDVLLEYIALSSSHVMTPDQAERINEIMLQAQSDSALYFWLNEVDFIITSKPDLVTDSFVERQQECLEQELMISGFEFRKDGCNMTIEYQSVPLDEAISVELSSSELEVLQELSQKKEMSRSAIIRQALRVLGFIEERLSQGETFFFESPSKEKTEMFL
jgi:hypothetical protein